MSIRTDDYIEATCFRRSVNACHISDSLFAGRANSQRSGLARHTDVADVNIVVASGQTAASLKTEGDVLRACGIGIKRHSSLTGVVPASGVEKQCMQAIGSVGVTRRVAGECSVTGGSVPNACRVTVKRSIPSTGVFVATCISVQSLKANSYVVEP